MKYEVVLEKLDGSKKTRKFRTCGDNYIKALEKLGQIIADEYEGYSVDYWSLFDTTDFDQSVDDLAVSLNLSEIANCVYCKVVSSQIIA